MTIDFEENYLHELKTQYEGQFQELDRLFKSLAATTEYGRGGVLLHRGYYCPSPVQDILIGNVKRGSVSKRMPAKYDHIFYQDASGSLIMVDTYHEFGLSEREFLIYEGKTVIAPAFSVHTSAQETPLACVSVCQYSETGQIVSYRLLRPGIHEISAETFSYAPVSGLLDRSTFSQLRYGIVTSDCYQFLHDESGITTAFQRIITTPDGIEMVANRYLVPKSKQRKL